MLFPRETMEIGECIAVVHSRGNLKGLPILNSRPGAVHNGEKWSGARLSYHLNVARIPRGVENMKEGFVLHTCDNDWCINHRHLYLGTQQQNVIDMMSRNPTVRLNLAIAGCNRKQSKDTRMKISAALSGKPKTPEHRVRLSDAMTGNKNRF